MTETIEVKAASKGSVLDIHDAWACDCGKTHKFTPYAAAQWNHVIFHTCDCGTERDFRRGRVLSVTPKRK